mmetsp:Transcript_23153/g.75010  ORF Transcript_23153/g.75010 Transcript_23153/m.75010 type:complete len:216 (+) Transcript_23153:254-901(+)
MIKTHLSVWSVCTTTSCQILGSPFFANTWAEIECTRCCCCSLNVRQTDPKSPRALASCVAQPRMQVAWRWKKCVRLHPYLKRGARPRSSDTSGSLTNRRSVLGPTFLLPICHPKPSETWASMTGRKERKAMGRVELRAMATMTTTRRRRRRITLAIRLRLPQLRLGSNRDRHLSSSASSAPSPSRPCRATGKRSSRCHFWGSTPTSKSWASALDS